MNSSLIQFEKTALCPLADGRQLIRTEVEERCFIYQSFGMVETQFGDETLKPHVSFFADSGEGTAAEWEPQYGPIQIWKECAEDWEEKDGDVVKYRARAHWHFPFVEDHYGMWSQLGVDSEGLKGLLVRGHLDAVFGILMRWANDAAVNDDD